MNLSDFADRDAIETVKKILRAQLVFGYSLVRARREELGRVMNSLIFIVH